MMVTRNVELEIEQGSRGTARAGGTPASTECDLGITGGACFAAARTASAGQGADATMQRPRESHRSADSFLEEHIGDDDEALAAAVAASLAESFPEEHVGGDDEAVAAAVAASLAEERPASMVIEQHREEDRRWRTKADVMQVSCSTAAVWRQRQHIGDDDEGMVAAIAASLGGEQHANATVAQHEPEPEPGPELELEQKNTWACRICSKEGIGDNLAECPRCTAVRGRLPKSKRPMKPEMDDSPVVHGEFQQSARRERWNLLSAAEEDAVALVLAYQRLAWATSLVEDGPECLLDYLPLDAMVQIAEYQHSFVLPCMPPTPTVMLPRRVLCQVGVRCDAQDVHGDWYTAYVAAVNESAVRVLIHFVGWSEEFREWFDLDEQETLIKRGSGGRIAPLGRFTKRATQRSWWLAHDQWAPQGRRERLQTPARSSCISGTHDPFDLRLLPACKVCNQAVDSENTILCEGCEDSIKHTYCCTPPMEEPPEGIWYCPDCRLRAGMPAAQVVDDHVAAVAVAHVHMLRRLERGERRQVGRCHLQASRRRVPNPPWRPHGSRLPCCARTRRLGAHLTLCSDGRALERFVPGYAC